VLEPISPSNLQQTSSPRELAKSLTEHYKQFKKERNNGLSQ
jgi:hypothetical protein